MGSPPFSRTSRQRQPGEAPARAGAQQVGTGKGRSPEHGLERGGVTTPQAGGSSISRSQSTTQSPQPTTSQSRPPALHRIPDSPKQQQPLRRRRALARNDEVARAASSQDEMVLSGSGSGAARRLRNTPAAAAPTLPFGPLELQQQPPVAVVVVIPEGGGAKPPPPSMARQGDGRGLQESCEGTSALGATSQSSVAPRLFIIAALERVPEVHWSNPGQGNGPYWVKAGMAETGAAI